MLESWENRWGAREVMVSCLCPVLSLLPVQASGVARVVMESLLFHRVVMGGLASTKSARPPSVGFSIANSRVVWEARPRQGARLVMMAFRLPWMRGR